MTKTNSWIDDEIKTYYNRNTFKFLKWGKHAKTTCIHQPIYKNSKNIQEALHYPHQVIKDWILKFLEDSQSMRIADLGCGVGGTLAYLNQHLTKTKLDFVGITISSRQVNQARNMWPKSSNVKIICGNFLDYKDPQGFDMIYQIESFNHARSLEEMLIASDHLLKPGGLWIIFDDFISTESQGISQETIAQYRKGWILPNLNRLDKFLVEVKKSGYTVVQNEELTEYLTLFRTRDRWAKLFEPIIRIIYKKSYYLQSIYGGLARQRALSKGWLTYRGLVLRKS